MTQIASCNNSEPPVTHCMAKSSFWIKISLSITLGLHCIELSLLSIHLVKWMTMGDFEIWYQPLHHSQQNETDHLEFSSLCGILKPCFNACIDVLDNINFCNYCKKIIKMSRTNNSVRNV